MAKSNNGFNFDDWEEPVEHKNFQPYTDIPLWAKQGSKTGGFGRISVSLNMMMSRLPYGNKPELLDFTPNHFDNPLITFEPGMNMRDVALSTTQQLQEMDVTMGENSVHNYKLTIEKTPKLHSLAAYYNAIQADDSARYVHMDKRKPENKVEYDYLSGRGGEVEKAQSYPEKYLREDAQLFTVGIRQVGVPQGERTTTADAGLSSIDAIKHDLALLNGKDFNAEEFDKQRILLAHDEIQPNMLGLAQTIYRAAKLDSDRGIVPSYITAEQYGKLYNSLNSLSNYSAKLKESMTSYKHIEVDPNDEWGNVKESALSLETNGEVFNGHMDEVYNLMDLVNDIAKANKYSFQLTRGSESYHDSPATRIKPYNKNDDLFSDHLKVSNYPAHIIELSQGDWDGDIYGITIGKNAQSWFAKQLKEGGISPGDLTELNVREGLFQRGQDVNKGYSEWLSKYNQDVNKGDPNSKDYWKSYLDTLERYNTNNPEFDNFNSTSIYGTMTKNMHVDKNGRSYKAWTAEYEGLVRPDYVNAVKTNYLDNVEKFDTSQVSSSDKDFVTVNDETVKLNKAFYHDLTMHAMPRKVASFIKQSRTVELTQDVMQRLIQHTDAKLADVKPVFDELNTKLKSGEYAMTDTGVILDAKTRTPVPISLDLTTKRTANEGQVKTDYSKWNTGSMMYKQNSQQGVTDTFSSTLANFYGAAQNDNQTYFTPTTANFRNWVNKNHTSFEELDVGADTAKAQLKRKKATPAWGLTPDFDPYTDSQSLPDNQRLEFTLNNIVNVGAKNIHGFATMKDFDAANYDQQIGMISELQEQRIKAVLKHIYDFNTGKIDQTAFTQRAYHVTQDLDFGNLKLGDFMNLIGAGDMLNPNNPFIKKMGWVNPDRDPNSVESAKTMKRLDMSDVMNEYNFPEQIASQTKLERLADPNSLFRTVNRTGLGNALQNGEFQENLIETKVTGSNWSKGYKYIKQALYTMKDNFITGLKDAAYNQKVMDEGNAAGEFNNERYQTPLVTVGAKLARQYDVARNKTLLLNNLKHTDMDSHAAGVIAEQFSHTPYVHGGAKHTTHFDPGEVFEATINANKGYGLGPTSMSKLNIKDNPYKSKEFQDEIGSSPQWDSASPLEILPANFSPKIVAGVVDRIIFPEKGPETKDDAFNVDVAHPISKTISFLPGKSHNIPVFDRLKTEPTIKLGGHVKKHNNEILDSKLLVQPKTLGDAVAFKAITEGVQFQALFHDTKDSSGRSWQPIKKDRYHGKNQFGVPIIYDRLTPQDITNSMPDAILSKYAQSHNNPTFQHDVEHYVVQATHRSNAVMNAFVRTADSYTADIRPASNTKAYKTRIGEFDPTDSENTKARDWANKSQFVSKSHDNDMETKAQVHTAYIKAAERIVQEPQKIDKLNNPADLKKYTPIEAVYKALDNSAASGFANRTVQTLTSAVTDFGFTSAGQKLKSVTKGGKFTLSNEVFEAVNSNFQPALTENLRVTLNKPTEFKNALDTSIGSVRTKIANQDLVFDVNTETNEITLGNKATPKHIELEKPKHLKNSHQATVTALTNAATHKSAIAQEKVQNKETHDTGSMFYDVNLRNITQNKFAQAFAAYRKTNSKK